MCVDLSDWATTRNTVKEIGPIDLLVNSAAIFRQVSFLDAEETDLNEYGNPLHYRKKICLYPCICLTKRSLSDVCF